MVIRGKYEILERIGSGGMASVYRARHLAFGEVCAIKVVAAKLTHDDTFLKRFRNEAVVTRRLQHPHAVHVQDLDTTEDGRPFIVMDFVEGRNLRDVIRQEAPLQPRRAAEITRQVAAALAAAHALGIVHRDIKPDNIILAGSADGSEQAKVLDFGIAKVRESVLGEDAYTPTRTGMVVGTPQYVSPEQAMGKRGEEIDGRSDLYSLGVVLYEMLTGRLPFASDTAMGMILHHLQTAPTPPNLARPDLELAAPLSDLLMTTLQKDPARRFATADDMVVALEGVLEQLPALPGTSLAGATAVPLRTPTPPASSRPLPAAAPARSTPPPGTPPPGQRPTPQPAATRVEDIAERPTRLFPGGGDATTSVGAPTVMGSLPRTTPYPVPPPPPPREQRPPGRRRWLGKTAIVAGVVLLMAMFVDLRRLERRQQREAERQAAESSASPAGPQAAGAADDGDLQDNVERLLSSARATKEANIDVEVDKGVVTLSGSVEDPTAAQVAEALAESVPGVKEVHNDIEQSKPQGKEKANGRVMIPLPGLPPIIFGKPGGHPGGPPSPGTPQHEALTELLREGKKALARGDAQEAMAIYGSALTLDGRNEEARRGLQAAARQVRIQMRRQWGAPEEAPPAPPAPAVPRAKPVPEPSGG
jgi:serine/threonine protein kinase